MNGMPVPPRKFKVLLHAPKLEGEVQELQPEGYSEQHTTLAKVCTKSRLGKHQQMWCLWLM